MKKDYYHPRYLYFADLLVIKYDKFKMITYKLNAPIAIAFDSAELTYVTD